MSERPSTSSAILTNTRMGGGGFVGEGFGSRATACREHDKPDASFGFGPVPRSGQQQQISHPLIDMGLASDAVPRPIVWNERQMASAAAVAAGRSSSAGVERGFRAGMTKGGVVVDARYAKVRKVLRRDVLEVAERAKLPLVH